MLLLGRKTLAFVKHKSRLRGGLVFFRFGDRRDELGTASGLNDLLCGLPRLVEFPMSDRIFVESSELGDRKKDLT